MNFLIQMLMTYLSQQANKIEGKWLRDNVVNFDLGLENLMNSSTDTIESGCVVECLDTDSDVEVNEFEKKTIGQECEPAAFVDVDSDE